jgi:hypothetical protein
MSRRLRSCKPRLIGCHGIAEKGVIFVYKCAIYVCQSSYRHTTVFLISLPASRGWRRRGGVRPRARGPGGAQARQVPTTCCAQIRASGRNPKCLWPLRRDAVRHRAEGRRQARRGHDHPHALRGRPAYRSSRHRRWRQSTSRRRYCKGLIDEQHRLKMAGAQEHDSHVRIGSEF